MGISEAEKVKIIENSAILSKDEGAPKELREILFGLLSIIGEMNTTITSLKETVSVDVAIKNFSTRSTKIVDSHVSKIEQVQNYLTNEHKEQYYKETTSSDKEVLANIIENYVKEKQILFDGLTAEETCSSIIKTVLGWDVLDELMNDAGDVEEIQIDDFKDINIIKEGKKYQTDLEFSSPAHLRLFVNKLILKAGKDQTAQSNLSEKNPFIRVRIGESTRVSIMGGGIARRNPGLFEGECIHVCIRKQKKDPITVEKLKAWKSVDDYGCLLLKYGLAHGVSICAFGGTGSGKTASLRAFLDFVPDDVRIITLAETDEMNLRKVDYREFIDDVETGNKIKNPRFLKAINSVLMWEMANLEQEIIPGKKGFVAGVNASLTFTPDMIILQESKGGEIKDVIEEAISGHQVLTTIHVNESKNVPLRILLMFQQSGTNISSELILKQVPAAFPWIVHFKRLRDGTRKIFEISELTGFNIVTGDPIVRPLLLYKIKSTYKDDNGKLIIDGEHQAVFNPMSGVGLKIMRENGLTDKDMTEISNAYEDNKPNKDDMNDYMRIYGISDN